jgi:hypothetical protein
LLSPQSALGRSNAIQLRASPINSRSWRRAAGQRVNIKTVNIHDCSRFVHGQKSAVPRGTALLSNNVHDCSRFVHGFSVRPIRVMSCRCQSVSQQSVPCHADSLNILSCQSVPTRVMSRRLAHNWTVSRRTTTIALFLEEYS